MKPKVATLLKVLINRYHKGSLEDALSFLPDDEADLLREIRTESQDPLPALAKPEELIKKVHYSWLKPFLTAQPEILRALFLSSLPKEQSEKLSRAFKISQIEMIPTALKSFLLQQVKQSLFDPSFLPLPYLPKSSLNALANLSKPELLTLIDYFGLYDLAESIRQIVDKRIIKQIYNCLTPKKQDFLRQTLHQREQLTSTPIQLEQWKGDEHELKQTLHLRGLLRLGVVLADQHPDLRWQVCHTLDTGRAAVIHQCMEKEKTKGVGPALTQQLMNLMNYLKPKSLS